VDLLVSEPDSSDSSSRRRVPDETPFAAGSIATFTEGGMTGDRGVIVARPGVTDFFGNSTWCFGTYPNPTPTPDQFLAYLQLNPPTAGDAGPLDVNATTFDGLPARSVRVDAGRCPTLFVFERTQGPMEPEPGVLTVFEVAGTTVVVAIWGHTNAILEEWLPTATRFVETIHFVRDSP
jgi:hypothetical protein